MSRIKDLIACHHRHKVFRLTQVDDIMCPARNHIDCFNLIPGNLKRNLLACIDISLFDQPMSMHHNELFPFAVVPVLSLCNTWLGNINRHLSTIHRMYKLCKRTSVVTVHLHRILKLLCRKIRQIQREELLRKTSLSQNSQYKATSAPNNPAHLISQPCLGFHASPPPLKN